MKFGLTQDIGIDLGTTSIIIATEQQGVYTSKARESF